MCWSSNLKKHDILIILFIAVDLLQVICVTQFLGFLNMNVSSCAWEIFNNLFFCWGARDEIQDLNHIPAFD